MSPPPPDEFEQQYFFVGTDGKLNGPMPRYRVIELLEREFITEQDRVGRVGGEKIPLAHHPDFAGYFIEGDSRKASLDEARIRRGRRIRKHRLRERERRVVRLAFFGGLLLFPFLTYELRFMLFPDIMLEWMHARVFGGDDAPGGVWSDGSSGGDGGRATEQGTDAVAVLVQGLRENHPQVSVKASLLYDEGWKDIVGGSPVASDQAIPKMESAVVASEGASWALAGLVAAHAASDAEGESSRRSIDKLLGMLEKMESAGPDHSAAQAAVALFSGDPVSAYGHADDCQREAQGAPECLWMAAAALGRSGRSEALAGVLLPALEAYPDSPELGLWSASLALERKDWAGADAALQAIEGKLSERGDFLEQRANLRLATGQIAGALADFSTLSGLVVDGRSAGMMEAALLYQVEGLHEKAADKLSVLAKGDLEDFSQSGELFLHASHASRMAGRLQDALQFAELALDAGTLNPEALLAKAMAHDSLGQLSEADAAFDRIDGTELSRREAARFHAWGASFFLRGDRARMAANQLASAELADPHWAPLVLLGAQLDLRLKDGHGLRSRLGEGLLKDIDQEAGRLPLVRNFGMQLNPRELLRDTATEFGRSPEFSQSIPSMLGAIQLLSCAKGTPCLEAKVEFERALRQNPNDWMAHAGMGRLAIWQEDWVGAESHMDGVLVQHVDSAVAQSLMGLAQAGQGKLATSRGTLERALRMDAGGTAAGRALLASLVALGEWEEAERIGEIVRRLDPNDSVTASLLRTRPVARKKSAD
jgi:tetratricopeptide (TPR) repeat protein